MTLQHIYDKETGKLMRSQEPVLDKKATEFYGRPVYCEYPNCTEKPLPAYGEHEAPFFIDGEWVVKGQYKGLEVYDTEKKTFEYCYDEELKENQVFIDDKEGIEKFKTEYQKWIVDENFHIVPNPNYETIQKVNEIDAALAQADSDYQNALETPVVFPLTGKLYKPKWIDDGTYAKLITGVQSGILKFPQNIWDATEKEENMVSMDMETFGALCAFLAQKQGEAFAIRKALKSELLAEKEKYTNETVEEIAE